VTVAVKQPSASAFSLKHKVRFVTAASLFDGHDAAIQIMRRVLQQEGAEVIHLGHDRSVKEVVDAAVSEDAQGVAVSSYQGGHVEYFTYMLTLLQERGASHIKVFGGGGGVIVPDEIALLQQRGVTRIYSPEDGRKMGLVGMIRDMLLACDHLPGPVLSRVPDTLPITVLARLITTLELAHDEDATPEVRQAAMTLRADVEAKARALTVKAPIVGVTGTGGAGKSSLIDEVLLRFLEVYPKKTVAVLSVDPTRRKSGGALLGDRIRVNAARSDRVFLRSMATRRRNAATSPAVRDALAALQLAGFDLVMLETAGIGQSDSEVSDLVGTSVYVMTPEFGAPSQLEKIDMLDFADLVVVNKVDKRGALDALRDVRKTYQRNRKLFDTPLDAMPVFGTAAHRFNDKGTDAFCNALFSVLERSSPGAFAFTRLGAGVALSPSSTGIEVGALIPAARTRYLGEIAEALRARRALVEEQALLAERAHACLVAAADVPAASAALRLRHDDLLAQMQAEARTLLASWDEMKAGYERPAHAYVVRGKEHRVDNYTESLSHNAIPKVVVPDHREWGARVRFGMKENVPGAFPFTGGVFPYKRTGEDPTRMFAGEGTPERTNRRFHYVSKGQPAVRLSTAFDSVTLYGQDPALRPDIYGKVGNAGVSVCCLDDAKRLYSGFDVCAPTTSVSMTINGPAPTVLAYYLNAAIDAAIERRLKQGDAWTAVQARVDAWFSDRGVPRPRYRGELPPGHDGMGLGFLGVSADRFVDRALYDEERARVLHTVRGTVQADILKEDQAQNTCIFSSEFSLRMMGDVQQYFVDHDVGNFYSVSISGYHIAEAGANPITQLAFTLANGFTLVEYYRARGMAVDDFAPNLSFFFSNGLDPEYAVIGRVARRIWAVAMRDLYHASERSQKLKYHIQTSGRSLHAQEMAFNDIRTTLQALYAIADNCNSLHTNAYDEAVTTPTEESVRRAIAIQLVINREAGVMKNENTLQGSAFIELMTDLVEEAVLKELESLDARGGVLGAMETMYQRAKIQEESLYYEAKKHSGELPIIGVNTFLPDHGEMVKETALIRSSDDEKRAQIDNVFALAARYADERAQALKRLKDVACAGGNVFAELMETTKTCSLGSISHALFEVGGAYRRSM
jgi:methylmalonyl-CoA mutase